MSINIDVFFTDNAVDPDVKATKFWIDVEEDNGEPRLCFTDNGFGMESEKLHKMLSFGYCEKVCDTSQSTI